MRKIFAAVLIVFGSATASAENPLDMIKDFRYMVSIGALQAAFAKELCSCRYVSGLTLKQCLSHSGIPSAAALMMSIDDDEKNARMVVTPLPLPLAIPYLSTAEAVFDRARPYRGCRLVRSQIENSAAPRPPAPVPVK